MRSKIVFLSSAFFSRYPDPPYKEIEKKPNRPYMAFLVQIESHYWALPFRSNIHHGHAFFTDAANHCGIDYSKAVLVDDPSCIDRTRTPRLRDNKFKALKGNEFVIQKGFERYIREYRKARKSGHPRYKTLLECSTLQYFEDALE